MQTSKKLCFLHILPVLNFFFPINLADQQNPTIFCGKFKIQTPFAPPNSMLSHMVLCKSQKLYFRTSLGLFPVSSIDYTTKLLTISHSFSSSSSKFISPLHLSSGFTPPPQPNSLMLTNCSTKSHHHISPFFHNCKADSFTNSCLIVDDIANLEMDFHPKDLNCSNYIWVYRNTTTVERFEVGTRVSFDMPDHVPNPCDECEKKSGNCGVGLKCICHPKECRDRVVNLAVMMNPLGNIVFSLLLFIFLMDHFKGS